MEFSLMDDKDTTKSLDHIILDICLEICNRLPSAIEWRPSKLRNHSFESILRCEIKNYNNLLKVIVNSLNDVQRMIQGNNIPFNDFEQIFNEIANNKIPSHWMNSSYLTMKSLSSYVNDLTDRVQFFKNLLTNDKPNTFWISAFYFPQAIIAASKQAYCKRLSIDYDDVCVTIDVTSFHSSESNEFNEYLQVFE